MDHFLAHHSYVGQSIVALGSLQAKAAAENNLNKIRCSVFFRRSSIVDLGRFRSLLAVHIKILGFVLNGSSIQLMASALNAAQTHLSLRETEQFSWKLLSYGREILAVGG